MTPRTWMFFDGVNLWPSISEKKRSAFLQRPTFTGQGCGAGCKTSITLCRTASSTRWRRISLCMSIKSERDEKHTQSLTLTQSPLLSSYTFDTTSTSGARWTWPNSPRSMTTFARAMRGCPRQVSYLIRPWKLGFCGIRRTTRIEKLLSRYALEIWSQAWRTTCHLGVFFRM